MVQLHGEAQGADASVPALLDVAIVGGGIAGSAAAAVLGRQEIGCRALRVALIDLHQTFPQDFRADKVAGDQIDLMKRLGLFQCLVANSARIGSVINIRRGRVVDRQSAEEYNLPYEDLVNAVRGEIPGAVELVVGRVADIEAGENIQRVTLSDGRIVTARLVILATGNGEALRKKLGLTRRILRKSHSVSLGFDLKPVGREAFDFEALTSYGGHVGDRVDYISLFPFRRALRANLFVYRDPRDPWLATFMADPARVLIDTLPGLAPWLGAFEAPGKPHMRPMDLYEVDGVRRSGIVLIGDAYRTGCPAVGSGLSRGLTDIDRLCNVHLPNWLASPGMGADKIAAFYDDPVKRACEARSAHAAEYRRASTIGEGLRWDVHRRRVFLQRRLRALISGGARAARHERASA